MNIWQAAILGLVQGLTEFLPVSSSGHLVLAQALLGVEDLIAMKGFDIAVHFGTLLAIFIYFRRDYLEIIEGCLSGIKEKIQKKELSEKAKINLTMAGIMIVGTMPAVVVGVFLGDWLDEHFLNTISVSIMLVIFAIVFLFAEKTAQKYSQHRSIGWKEGLLIGCGQALALIPGVSRSGATISTGLILGVERAKAARFSFLLGSVAMVAATCLAVLKVYKGEYSLPENGVLITGIATSFVSGWIAISFLMNYLRKNTLKIFAWYRILVVIAFWMIMGIILK